MGSVEIDFCSIECYSDRFQRTEKKKHFLHMNSGYKVVLQMEVHFVLSNSKQESKS